MVPVSTSSRSFVEDGRSEAVTRFRRAVAKLAQEAQYNVPHNVIEAVLSLPEPLLKMVVEGLEKWVENIELEKTVEKSPHYVPLNPKKPLIVLSLLAKHRDDVVKAFEELQKLLEEMKRVARTKKIELGAPLTYRDLGENRVLAVVLEGEHRGTKLERLELVARKMGFDIRTERSEDERAVYAVKEMNKVRIYIDAVYLTFVGRFGLIYLDIEDQLPENP